MGYLPAEGMEDADIVVFNTCCVRENAENKVYGNLGRLKYLKQKKKDLKVVVAGCMVQQDSVIEKIKKTHRHVDVIFGTFNLRKFPELLYANITQGGMIIDVWKDSGEIIETSTETLSIETPHKASVNIMYGCDNFCSYCVVPYVRGRERSRKPEDILKEIETFARKGVKEILLLGQNVNSYSYGFANLLKETDKVEGIRRVRFASSHPKDISDELIYAIRDCENVCAQLHLPLQSGSDETLKKMNRNYTKERYLSIIKKAKKEIPNLALSTDIIVGFPTETEEDFEETLDVARQAGFSAAFTFIYSRRVGTPAAKLPEIPADIVQKRFDRLVKELNEGFYNFNASFVGKTVEVLIDEIKGDLLTGRTEQNALVHFRKPTRVNIGEFTDVKITGNKSFYLTGF
jgi:tRNA-2-methylthio-N6-dimethylallyladenosine synthase